MLKTRSRLLLLATAAFAAFALSSGHCQAEEAPQENKTQPAQAATPVQPDSTQSASSEDSKKESKKEKKKEQDSDEIVVTATRTETPVSKTGASTTVITRQQIEDQQLHTVAEALEEVPGVAVAQSGTPGQVTGLFIRGTKTESTQVIIDGRRIPFNLAGSFGVENLALDDVERIEVVRGPLSSVQGGPAIGGVINIITRSGKGLDKPEFTGGFEAGSFQTFHELASARGACGPFDYSVQAGRLDTDNERPNNQYRLTNVTTKEGYQINDQLYADLLFFYNLADVGTPNSVSDPEPIASLLRETWMISPGLDYKTTDWWEQKVYYSHSQQRQVASDFKQAANFFPPPATLNFGQDNRVQVDTDQVDYQSDFQIAQPWKLSAGFSMTDARYYRKIDVPNEFNFPATPAGTTDVQNNLTNSAGFLQSQWEIVHDLNVTSSIRLDHESDFGDYITWRTGGSYRVPVTRSLVHASYGTAFSPPTPQDTALAFGGNPMLTPELSKGYDAGIEQPFWDNRIKASATYFHNDISNLIIFDSMFTLHNIGQARTQGGEFGLSVSPIQELTLSANYTYLDAWDLSNNQPLARRPRNQMSFNVIGKPCSAVVLNLGGLWVADRTDGFNPTPIEDYFVMRFAASYKVNPHLEVFGRIENLLNESYEEVRGFPALGQAAYAGFKLTY
ncbi:MAG: TonB-dependent receptor [Methylacidiphilales bacterium]|nr:TonB-dependent receptor [Candidatus Methylacidiphilales bacterium]